MTKYWHKTTFWENVKRTFATFGGGVVFGVHELSGADIWVGMAAVFTMIGGILSIWMVDNNDNNIVDMFENDDEVRPTP